MLGVLRSSTMFIAVGLLSLQLDPPFFLCQVLIEVVGDRYPSGSISSKVRLFALCEPSRKERVRCFQEPSKVGRKARHTLSRRTHDDEPESWRAIEGRRKKKRWSKSHKSRMIKNNPPTPRRSGAEGWGSTFGVTRKAWASWSMQIVHVNPRNTNKIGILIEYSG